MSVDEIESAGTGHRIRDLASRLYRGEAGVNVIGRKKIFYAVAGVILLVAVITIFVRPFNLSTDFKGGNTFTLPASVGSLADVRGVVEDQGVEVSAAQQLGGATDSYLITTAAITPDQDEQVKAALAQHFSIPAEQISDSAVSGAWGASVTTQAAIGAGVFLVLVVIYLSLVFREWKMAVAALAALFQNLFLTAAVYLLVGFEVSPSTVIGFLTILGFALYDVVVVFDKVRENTRGITGNPNRTYGEAANLAVNQTIMRSINTAIVSLLPVAGLLVIGSAIGAGTLKDLGLVLFIGMLAAVYSSIFLATPVLVNLKEAEPRFALHKQRVLARRAAPAAERQPVKVTATVGKTKVAAAKSVAASKAATAKPATATSAKPAAATSATAKAAPRPVAKPTQPVSVEDLDEFEAEEELPVPLPATTTPRPGARPTPRKRQGQPARRPGGGSRKR